MASYVFGANVSQFDAYRANRSGAARNVTWVADSTTLAMATGSGHTIIELCAYHARADANVIEAQVAQMVAEGRASVQRHTAAGS